MDIPTNQAGQPVVPTSARTVKSYGVNKAASLAAGATEYTELTVPAGKQWWMLWGSCRVVKPAGGGSGTHEFYLSAPDNTGGSVPATIYPTISASKAYSADISAGTVAYFSAVLALPAGQTLRLNYNNSTDVAQTNERRIVLVYAEENLQ